MGDTKDMNSNVRKVFLVRNEESNKSVSVPFDDNNGIKLKNCEHDNQKFKCGLRSRVGFHDTFKADNRILSLVTM